MKTKRLRTWERKLRTANLCSRCGQSRGKSRSSWFCAPCLLIANLRSKEYKRALEAKGLCRNCGKRKAGSRNTRYCDPCYSRLLERCRLRVTGFDADTYADFFKVQNGCCAICKTKPTTRELDADHDHKTGNPRGLLCSKCNIGLGCFNDDPRRLVGALEYLGIWLPTDKSTDEGEED